MSLAADARTPSQQRMHVPDERLTSLILEYVSSRLSMPETPLDHPGQKAEVDAILDGLVTREGMDPERVLEIYAEHLSQTVLSADSPRYWAFIPAAPTKAALLFDMVVSAASLQGISWLEAAGAVAAENQALRWISDAAGLPASAGGAVVSGGSAGNLSALVVARDTARRRLVARDGEQARYRRLRVAVSDQAHSSVRNTLSIIDVDPLVITTADHRFTGDALRAALDADADPESVVAVVATSGTTNAGIIDDLLGVGTVARERGLWFHVDGAYGGAGLFAPSVRDRYVGLELADSFVVDPHKWLFAPYDCAALLYREPRLAKAVHTQDASYLDAIHHDDGSYEWNPTDYAYHLTRRARGLPLWFSLVVNGTDAYTEAIEHSISLAAEVAREIDATEHLELLREPTLGMVLFRRTGWTAADYDAWAARLLAEQIAFVTSTSWEGETVGRFSFIHPGTTLEMLREVLATTA
ncbi:MAG TPA: pyridoxal-dependent decarboxylase [Candidatus Angelobacter sp.]|nr:pyridoxal-dependent decarboxylase [Candidatus Angelobacter sp.]